MIPNDRPTPNGPREGRGSYYSQRSPVSEETLKTETIQIERKTFSFTLKENPRGRFLRITEDVGGRRDNVIVPATGLEDFLRVLADMVQTSARIPPKNPS